MNFKDSKMTQYDSNNNHMEENKKMNGMGLNHGILMILCCLIPILFIAILPFIGAENTLWRYAIFLLCPLMHIGMMFFMKDKH